METTTTPAEKADGTTETATPNDFRRRRWTAAAAVVAVIAVGAFLTGRTTTSTTTETTADGMSAFESATVGGAAGPDGARTVNELLVDAQTHRAATGSYDGFAADGVLVASATDAVVVATVVNGECWFGGILPDQPATEPQQDATACDPALVADVQVALDVNEADVRSLSYADAAVTLSGAGETAAFWATRNVVNGTPSLAGFPADAATQLRLREIAVDGTTMVVEALDPAGQPTGWCATVTATGAVSDVTDCR